MHKILSSVISTLLLALCSSSYASEYSQPDFYNVHHYILNNGLRVVLKPRNIAKNVSIRLSVKVGANNFECGKHETAHYLEHLLFTGTSKHSEDELDDLIESHGGYWNASTTSDYTTFKVDIFSKYTNIGLSTLHEIISDSQITEENIRKSLKIIYREAGEKPSKIRNWLHKEGYIYSSIQSASNELLVKPSWLCPDINQAADISSSEIIETYANYYVPQNMTLSIVGDFDLDSIKQQIKSTLGAMKKSRNVIRNDNPVPDFNEQLDESVVFTGRFKPLLGTDATVYQIYRTPNMHHKDNYVFEVLEQYFYREMYKLLRVENGLAYSPDVSYAKSDKFGIFIFSTDSEIEDAEVNIKLISKVISKFKDGDLDQKELDETKLKILLSEARGYETNEDFSNYYIDNAFELEKFGRLISYTDEIEKVTLEDIQRVSKKYFHAGNRVIAVSSPTMTYTQLYMLLLVIIVLVLGLSWRLVIKLKKKGDKTVYL